MVGEEGRRLAEDEALLRKVQDEQAELIPTCKGLFVMIEPCRDNEKVLGFFRDLMAYAGKVTQSIKPDGALTSRFVMAGPSLIAGRPFICLSCFNRGFEMLEFALVYTKAQVLAVQYGLKIAKIDTTPDIETGRGAGNEGGVETSKNGRKIVGRITFPDGGKSRITAVVNDQFKDLSAVATIFIMMTAGVSGRTGKALGEFVKASLDANPKLLEAMAERASRMYQMEIVSTEVVEAKDLETQMHGKNSFAFWGVPES